MENSFQEQNSKPTGTNTWISASRKSLSSAPKLKKITVESLTCFVWKLSLCMPIRSKAINKHYKKVLKLI